MCASLLPLVAEKSMQMYIGAENSNYFQPAALRRRPTSLEQLSFSSPGSLLIFPNSDLLYDSPGTFVKSCRRTGGS